MKNATILTAHNFDNHYRMDDKHTNGKKSMGSEEKEDQKIPEDKSAEGIGAKAASSESAPFGEKEARAVSKRAAGPAWEEELDEYPLRDPKADPNWAVRIVKIWVVAALSFLTFVVVLLILGMFYE